MQGGAKTDLGNLGEKHIEMNRNRRRKSLSRQELNRAPRLQEGLPSATWKKNPNQSRCFPVRSERVSEAVTSPPIPMCLHHAIAEAMSAPAPRLRDWFLRSE